MSRATVGKVLLSLTALNGGVGAFIADWNETHIYNPDWPPHAKFHNAQTMSLGAGLSLIALTIIWERRTPWSLPRLKTATVIASLYSATQLSALAYPGTALVDPPTDRKGPQAVVAAVILVINLIAFRLGRAALRRA